MNAAEPGHRQLQHEVARVVAGAECLYTRQQVEAALDRMAADVAERLQDADPVLLCVMLGGLVTTGMLATRLGFPVQIDYVHVGRYADRTRGGELVWHRRPTLDLAGRTVLIVDDILDEGHTLAELQAFCTDQGVERAWSAVLTEKRHGRRLPGIRADFVGLEVADRYVFGYGMDYKGYLRNMPGIFAVAGHREAGQ